MVSNFRRLAVMAAVSATFCAFVASATDNPGQPAVVDRSGTAWLNRQMSSLSARSPEKGWSVTPSGLRWRRVGGDGTGVRPLLADKVKVHYVGTFEDGEEFDSSIRRGEPITFPLNLVIKGWQEGVALAGVGDKIELAIPYYLAYGAAGKGPIPGGATLFFTVELLDVEREPVGD